jgi:hypothetical protein
MLAGFNLGRYVSKFPYMLTMAWPFVKF